MIKIRILLFLLIVFGLFLVLTFVKLISNINQDYYSNSNLNDKLELIDNFNGSLLMNITGRKYVFIDLGANKGDSVASFLGLNNQLNMIKFPSFVLNRNQIDQVKWDVYLFEANPIFNQQLHEIKQLILKENKANSVHLYNSTAAWIYDGSIDFYLDILNVNYDFHGSSLHLNHPDVIKSGKQKIRVPCVDLARLLKQSHYTINDFIILKIDVEGSEYELLVHLIKENVLNLIDLMPIEYHPNVVKDRGLFQTGEQTLNFILNSYGIKVLKWI